MKNHILYLLLVSIILFSCKKYEEDKNYSTYTALGRLCNKGNWQITEILNLNSGQTNVVDSGLVISFDITSYNFYSKTGNVSIESRLQYSNILKPAFLNIMIEPTDLILLGNENDNNPFEFTDNKNKLNMKTFISFGYIQNNTFMIRQTVDVEFDIERLELGTLQLNFQDKMKIIMKKVPE